MPPEAVQEYYESIDKADRFLSPGADLWQLGLTLFEALTLMTPHFHAVEIEMLELKEKHPDESFDEGELFDDILGDMIGRRPSLPYWIHDQIQRDPRFQAVFDVFIATTEMKVAQRPSAATVVELMSA